MAPPPPPLPPKLPPKHQPKRQPNPQARHQPTRQPKQQSKPLHSILDGLNPAQRRAVVSDAATVAILAGPGSGKTHTLTARVVWLVDHVGFRPEDVIVATFTVKAAREMKHRIGRALGNGREKRLILGTFHSIARRYLAAYGRYIGLAQRFGIADDADSRALVERICKRLQLPLDPRAARAWISKKKAKGAEDPSKPASKTASKPARPDPHTGPGLKDLETCYQEYQDHLEKSNLLDYDDLLVRCVELLRKHPSCVSNIQIVLIDEYQDTNGVQYDLMKLLAQRHQRITTVGDPDQSIYGWRSAEIRNLWKMLREFPKTDEIALEENYRSSQSILDFSLQVIQQDQKRYQKKLKPVHNRGSRPVLRRLKSPSTEADWLVSEIRRVHALSGTMLTHNDFAILLRSASLSRHIESSLGKAGIAYRMVGGFKFYDRAEIKTLIDYLRVIQQPENNDALARIINVPRRGIGTGTIKDLLEEAETSKLSLWDVLSKHCRGDRNAKTRITKHAEQSISGGLLRPLEDIRKLIREAAVPDAAPFGLVQMMERLLTKLDFQKHLEKVHAEDHEGRWANVREFVNLAADFVRELDVAEDDALPEIDDLEQTKEVEVLPRFLANVSLAADAQTGDDDQESKPVVTISTIHAAKGLEWPVVFVPAVYNGSIPHARAEDDDEERRLLYVAMTRAQTLLYLSCPLFSANGNGERTELSPFVEPVKGAALNKGPCLDRPVMEEIAKILRRKLPDEDSIYQDLPAMLHLEDNLFPVDPEAARAEAKGGLNRMGGPSDGPPSKRPRLYGPAGERDGGGEEVDWKEPTTLEQRSKFTVSSLPGFVSVAAHQAAITAANVEVEAERKLEQKTKAAAKKRPADQKTLTAFLSNSASTRPAADVPPEEQKVNAAPLVRNAFGAQPQPAPAQPAIAPDLAAHKLGGGAMMTRPTRAHEDEPGQRKQYAFFSSSPPLPGSAGGDGNNAAKSDDEGEPSGPTQPAASMHRTTCTMRLGLGGGVRRPPRLGMEGMKPMETLRKPFKPLTMRR
ncbi:P-loop containing nucleoside triphosphate hydrolase protein [Staphylotrichum tortipilum]|uniref:DNA 3'-5' helicase n=1 Tax=Staphylotrichum tortipilum TaxID=2831512 RepID=A0AAN6MPA5_9PEZI|nr:P-loop containing nucleoside triphosphate hydrolase protein [Staphylotrichum longicolle]